MASDTGSPSLDQLRVLLAVVETGGGRRQRAADGALVTPPGPKRGLNGVPGAARYAFDGLMRGPP